jgi:hypothetical protein
MTTGDSQKLSKDGETPQIRPSLPTFLNSGQSDLTQWTNVVGATRRRPDQNQKTARAD